MAAGAAVWAAAGVPELVAGLVLVGPSTHDQTPWHIKLLFRTLRPARGTRRCGCVTIRPCILPGSRQTLSNTARRCYNDHIQGSFGGPSAQHDDSTLVEGARTYHAYINECSGLYMAGPRTART